MRPLYYFQKVFKSNATTRCSSTPLSTTGREAELSTHTITNKPFTALSRIMRDSLPRLTSYERVASMITSFYGCPIYASYTICDPCCTYHGSDRDSYTCRCRYRYGAKSQLENLWLRRFWAHPKEVFISCNITDHFMLFVPCIVISNTNQRNAQFSKLVFNFCCVLHALNVMGSSSGRQLYMQCIGVSSLVDRRVLSTVLSTRLLTPKYVKRTIVHIQLFAEDKPTAFGTCRTQQKLNTNQKTVHFVGLCYIITDLLVQNGPLPVGVMQQKQEGCFDILSPVSATTTRTSLYSTAITKPAMRKFYLLKPTYYILWSMKAM